MAYHGMKLESREEHRKWMGLVHNSDEVKRDGQEVLSRHKGKIGSAKMTGHR